ncbi:MAG: tRNA pseudouridine(13) synthase TruD, partial [Candidatus Bathyarchaeota archaeon]
KVGKGRYLVCVLVKKNWDTILAVEAIAEKLGLSAESIGIAGIKDAKAVTAQHISIGRTTPEQVSRVKIRDINLYPLRFVNEKIYPGFLLGNRFRIVIRAVTHSSSIIEKRMKNIQLDLLSLGGIPNFFGHQRFGTVRPITHVVGKHITKGEWKKAALTYLAKSSEHEHPEARRARQQLWNTRDFKAALYCFPQQLRYERFMLNHLAKHQGDFVGSFRRLPMKLCRLFVQAYQSFLFNKFLSARMKHEMPLNQILNEDYTVKVDNTSRVALPLVGFKQPVSTGEQGEIEKEILEEEDVKPNDFHIPQNPRMSASGRLRSVLACVNCLSVEKSSHDQVNYGKRQTRVDFMLPSGSYATVLLREFMKTRNLVKGGF